jgi:hypothetical protein
MNNRFELLFFLGSSALLLFRSSIFAPFVVKTKLELPHAVCGVAK